MELNIQVPQIRAGSSCNLVVTGNGNLCREGMLYYQNVIRHWPNVEVGTARFSLEQNHRFSATHRSFIIQIGSN